MINVKWFGAKGNDSNDDTQAIQNAINSLAPSGGIVHFPTGTYHILGTITIAVPGISLVGDRSNSGRGRGATLYFPVSGNTLDFIDITALDFKMTDIGLLGVALHGVGQAISGTYLNFFPGADNSVIEDCTLLGAYNSCVITSCSNIIFQRCRFIDISAPSTTPNFHINIMGTASAISSGFVIRDCSIGQGSFVSEGLFTTAIQMNEYTENLLIDNTPISNGYNALTTTVNTPGAAAPRNIRMKGFGTDQIDGYTANFEYAQNVSMRNSTYGSGALEANCVTVGAAVLGFMASNTFFRSGSSYGLSIAGRDVGIFNCFCGNNSLHPPVDLNRYLAQAQITGTADNVAIVGGMFSDYRNGDNPASGAIEIDAGARRVRIVGSDLSRNANAETGSFDFTGSSLGDTPIVANNLQAPAIGLLVPARPIELPAADFHFNFSGVSLVSATNYYIGVIGEYQQLWIVDVSLVITNPGPTTLTISGGSSAITIPFGGTHTNLVHDYPVSPPSLVTGATGGTALVLTVSAPVTSLLLTLACQSVS